MHVVHVLLGSANTIIHSWDHVRTPTSTTIIITLA